MTYEVQGRLDGTRSDPVISVTQHGQVISGSHTGQASLLITALEDFGVNQSVVILVKVTDHSTFIKTIYNWINEVVGKKDFFSVCPHC